MSWWEAVQETRLLVASSDPLANGDHRGCLVSLRHPKSGNATCYLLIDGGLQELNWFKQSYGSWFMGDYICADGRFYAATPVDPVFILLPIFDEARMKDGDDPGKFRQLDEIIYVHNFPEYHHLLSIAEKCMEVVCDCKEIGSTKFFRLNDSNVSAWMECKVLRLKQILLTLDKNYAARSEKDTLVDAVLIMGEYLTDTWLKLLCTNLRFTKSASRALMCEENFRLNIDEAVAPPQTEILSSAAASGLSSFSPVQELTGSDKRVTRSGNQNKKAKAETNSHSIRDMFSRASRKGK